jgi:hypothetical protein
MQLLRVAHHGIAECGVYGGGAMKRASDIKNPLLAFSFLLPKKFYCQNLFGKKFSFAWRLAPCQT